MEPLGQATRGGLNVTKEPETLRNQGTLSRHPHRDGGSSALPAPPQHHTTTHSTGVWLNRLEHRSPKPKVGGSNPSTPAKHRGRSCGHRIRDHPKSGSKRHRANGQMAAEQSLPTQPEPEPPETPVADEGELNRGKRENDRAQRPLPHSHDNGTAHRWPRRTVPQGGSRTRHHTSEHRQPQPRQGNPTGTWTVN